MMGDRAKVEDKLRRKEAEIVSLEEKIRTARVYVQALRDVLRVLSEDEEEDVNADTTLKPGSTVAQARDAILALGKPLHVNDILREMGKAVTRESKNSVIGSISAYVRRGEIFTRPAPNTFGLVEMGHQQSTGNVTEPPEDFGAPIDRESEDEADPFYVKDVP
jgi:hypothetical protein